MAETGEPFNVARRHIEAETAAPEPDDGTEFELIEVEVTDDDVMSFPSFRRHFESFWGRWIIEPVMGEACTAEHGHPEGAYYGVAQTRRGRIAVYEGMSNPGWPPRLADYNTLAEAHMPEDIRRRAMEVLNQREVIHRDI